MSVFYYYYFIVKLNKTKYVKCILKFIIAWICRRSISVKGDWTVRRRQIWRRSKSRRSRICRIRILIPVNRSVVRSIKSLRNSSKIRRETSGKLLLLWRQLLLLLLLDPLLLNDSLLHNCLLSRYSRSLFLPSLCDGAVPNLVNIFYLSFFQLQNGDRANLLSIA